MDFGAFSYWKIEYNELSNGKRMFEFVVGVGVASQNPYRFMRIWINVIGSGNKHYYPKNEPFISSLFRCVPLLLLLCLLSSLFLFSSFRYILFLQFRFHCVSAFKIVAFIEKKPTSDSIDKIRHINSILSFRMNFLCIGLLVDSDPLYFHLIVMMIRSDILYSWFEFI